MSETNGTFRPVRDGAFNDIHPWKYADIGKLIGAGGGILFLKESSSRGLFHYRRRLSVERIGPHGQGKQVRIIHL